MSRLLHLKTFAMTLLVMLVVPAIAVACPTCKDGIAGDPTNSGMVQGYGLSIVFMMSMPFLILSGISAYFYCLVVRARAANPTEFSPASKPANPAVDEPVGDSEAVPV